MVVEGLLLSAFKAYDLSRSLSFWNVGPSTRIGLPVFGLMTVLGCLPIAVVGYCKRKKRKQYMHHLEKEWVALLCLGVRLAKDFLGGPGTFSPWLCPLEQEMMWIIHPRKFSKDCIPNDAYLIRTW